MTRAPYAGLAALILLAALPAQPQAQKAKPQPSQQQKASPDADLGEKRDIAPDASLGGKLEGKRKAEGPAGPTVAFERFRKVTEVKISEKRGEEIASLRRLIELGGGGEADMPQWYFRLAELLWEESQYYFFEAGRRDDRLIELGTRGDPHEIDRLMAEKKDLDGQTQKLQVQAVALYKAIIGKYPDYPRLDEVLYFLAENLSRRKRDDPDALKAYRALITRFPNSRYVPDSWMAFGEYYFDKSATSDRVGNLKRALEAYGKAATYQESNVYGYALYKEGWVHYNLGAYDQAMDMFRAVIYFGELPTSTVPADRKLALVKEARKDYVRTYSHAGRPEGAIDEFRRVGGDANWWEMLKSLADIYYGDANDPAAIIVHARLIREKPLSVDAPFFQSRIVTSAGRMGRKEDAVRQAHRFVELLREIEQSSPEAKTEKGQKTLEGARANAEQTLRILATSYHNEWKKTRDEPVAGFAASVYRDYLDVFPDAPSAYEMRFFHAELRYALADFKGAGEEYDRVVLADVASAEGKNPDRRKPGKYFKDGLEASVFAWDLVVKKLDETEKIPPTDPRKRIPFAPARKSLLDACERYVKYQPAGEKWVEIAYKSANLYYRHNAFSEATDLFTRIALDHPEHEIAKYATNLVLDAYNLLGDWRNVNGWAKRFYANNALLKAHPGLKEDLARVIEQSAFKIVEQREGVKEYELAAEEYLAFSREWPESKLAPTALYNASVDYVKAGRLDKAMEIRDQFLQRFPADVLVPKANYDNAEAFEAIAEFGKAADLYEKYFRDWRRQRDAQAVAAKPPPKAKRGKKPPPPPPPPPSGVYEEKKANDAIINVAVFRAGLRDLNGAEAASLAYLETWPDGADAPKIFLGLADLYQQKKQAAKELAQLEAYQKKYASDPDEWLAIQQRIALLLEKSGNARGASDAYQAGLAYWKRNRDKVKDRGMALVAQAMYLDLEPGFAEYDKIGLNVAPKFLKAQLEVKAKKLNKLEEAYGEVVKLKQADPAICALYRIGWGYRRFADALFAVPMPKEFRGNPELVEEYKNQLAQFAEPLEAKAVEGLELAMNASRDYGVVNDCARKAIELLVKVKPEQYGPSGEVVAEIVRPVVRAAPRGYGPLAALQPAAPARPAGRRAEAALPALKVKAGEESRAAKPIDPTDPQNRVIADEPQVPKKKKKDKKGDDDEDLLP
jgi:tetratricopeptide (TPR) repeat protein